MFMAEWIKRLRMAFHPGSEGHTSQLPGKTQEKRSDKAEKDAKNAGSASEAEPSET